MFSPETVVLVTASSAGLGAATARAFATNGARVIVNYFSNAQKAEDLVLELERLNPRQQRASSSPRYIAIKADVSIKSELTRLVGESIAHMGQLDVVVSNQGWTRIRDFYNLDENVAEDDWDRCYNFNVKSHLFLFYATTKYLDATKGAFITTASLAGVIPSGSSLAYSVTKAAQIHLVKALAMISPSVRVNSVSPGILLTEWGLQFPKEKLENAVGKSPLKRLAIIEDVAEQIVCLAKSRSITGTNTIIDAGWSIS